MNALFKPSTLLGIIKVPPSKSMSHRAIISSSLADGISEITNVIFSKDIIATIDAMTDLGAKFQINEDSVIVEGIKTVPTECSIDCNESGSTLRFAIPIFCALGVKTTFSGKGKLPTRPITPYLTELTKNGITFDYKNNMPFSVSGKLKSGKYCIDGNISSQFITGLLFSLPLLESDSEIHINGKLESEPYVNMTLFTLNHYGINVEKTDYGYHILGNQKYKSADFKVESDYSQAAFFLVAAAIKNNGIICKGLSDYSTQGDKEILNIIKQCGCKIAIKDDSITVSTDKLKSFTTDATDIPDLVPILAVLASRCNGTSVINNIARLRIKESDRVKTTLSLINNIGGHAYEKDNSIYIDGMNSNFIGGTVDSDNDHRIAMATAIASTISDGEIKLIDSQCVDKSYPAFYEDFKQLGGSVNVVNMD